MKTRKTRSPRSFIRKEVGGQAKWVSSVIFILEQHWKVRSLCFHAVYQKLIAVTLSHNLELCPIEYRYQLAADATIFSMFMPILLTDGLAYPINIATKQQLIPIKDWSSSPNHWSNLRKFWNNSTSSACRNLDFQTAMRISISLQYYQFLKNSKEYLDYTHNLWGWYTMQWPQCSWK